MIVSALTLRTSVSLVSVTESNATPRSTRKRTILQTDATCCQKWLQVTPVATRRLQVVNTRSVIPHRAYTTNWPRASNTVESSP